MGIFNWWRLGSSGFGYSSTAEDVTEGIDATNLTAIVTGATSGIGKETARVLALRGANVIIPSRTIESGQSVKESLLEQNPRAKLQVMEMDLSSIRSIKSFADSFNSSHTQLNILINNAGTMACPYQLSMDGVEMQFAVNHLGHFLLTNLLLEKLKVTAKETGIQGRIVNISSATHTRVADTSWIDLKKINDKSTYRSFEAYSRSKLANIQHANELSRCLQEDGSNVIANSLHPGVIMTNIGRYLSPTIKPLLPLIKPFLKSIPQGAATICYVALHPNIKDTSGKYFCNSNETMPSSVARDRDVGKKLWDLSQDFLEKSGGKNTSSA
ncbi:hypothetical protein QJS04_geneDACA009141 [Acorus gramineus]|uniref:Uncharacterized protein n=1 Tax=Acorus gramineus TaxID=55184 RepID=A0AAV9APB1_ACOGR|nr:hypothetical protein QJS04_geneDACA009141 [Acorus gramineus]